MLRDELRGHFSQVAKQLHMYGVVEVKNHLYACLIVSGLYTTLGMVSGFAPDIPVTLS